LFHETPTTQSAIASLGAASLGAASVGAALLPPSLLQAANASTAIDKNAASLRMDIVVSPPTAT
jgi:hypothetical protein